MHRITPRLAARRLACAAVAAPVLLVMTGCSSDPDEGKKAEGGPSPSASSAAPAPVTYVKLPEPCGTLSGDTVEDVVPGSDHKNGKALASDDTQRYGSCLWSGGSGKNDSEYRALTVSLRRYESDTSLGSGDKQAQRFFDQESAAVGKDDANKSVKQSKVDGIGQEAVSVAYETEKKKHDYRADRVVVRDHNVVITVEYEGTGFEGADPPKASQVRKNAERVAKEAAGAVQKTAGDGGSGAPEKSEDSGKKKDGDGS